MIIKELDDYIDVVHAKHQRMKRKDVKRILEYGFRMLDNLIRNGDAVWIRDHRFWASLEFQSTDPSKTINYMKNQGIRKTRRMYRLRYEKFEGWYYTGLTDEQFAKLQKNISKNKPITLTNVYLYKVLDEVLAHVNKNHFLKIYYPTDRGFVFYKDKMKVDLYEYCARRSNDKLEILNGNCNRTD